MLVANPLSRVPVHTLLRICSLKRPYLWRRAKESTSVASVDNLTGNIKKRGDIEALVAGACEIPGILNLDTKTLAAFTF